MLFRSLSVTHSPSASVVPAGHSAAEEFAVSSGGLGVVAGGPAVHAEIDVIVATIAANPHSTLLFIAECYLRTSSPRGTLDQRYRFGARSGSAASSSASHAAAFPSDGARQSPRGDGDRKSVV